MPATPILDTMFAKAPAPGACVVFDIDNTDADTRFRTLHVARAFDAMLGTQHFAALTRDQVRLDGASTARALGVGADVAQAFQVYWESERGFWCGECFAHDRPLEPVAAWARRAYTPGYEVIWLTGRIEALRTSTQR